MLNSFNLTNLSPAAIPKSGNLKNRSGLKGDLFDYDGENENNLSNGIGIAVYKNGLKLEGKFIDDRLNGKGTVLYKGGFKAGNKHGFGRCYDKRFVLIHKGYFEDDTPVYTTLNERYPNITWD